MMCVLYDATLNSCKIITTRSLKMVDWYIILFFINKKKKTKYICSIIEVQRLHSFTIERSNSNLLTDQKNKNYGDIQ